MKRDITDQLPELKKQNLKHREYAEKSIQDLISPDKLSKAQVRLFNYRSSCIAWNNGNGTFRITPLPEASQLSSINKILCRDINNDGLPDLITGGNNDCFLPQFCQLDASFGNVLLNDGKGGWRELSPRQSGVLLRGVIRDIEPVHFRNTDCVLYLENDQKPRLYHINRKSNIASGEK
jgi:hypothetical protein